MSNVARVAGQAANTLVKPLNVEDVFSTYLYTGNGSTQTITNGVDLAGEGGLVWQKRRSSADSHVLSDTVRGLGQVLQSDTTGANQNLTSLFGYQALSDGFSFNTANSLLNTSGSTYASWTFRKAPKFFDVVTYAGDSVAGRTISHNLGSVPGMVIIKNLDVAVPWAVYHRSMGDGVGGGADENYYMNLNYIYGRAASSSYWNNTAPTSTTITFGAANRVNALNSNYVAYIFAHNDGDGEFGPDGDADIIKCGSYTGTGASGNEIDLGFEAQWVLVKTTSDANWVLHDIMRGMSQGGDRTLYANTSDQEYLFTGKEIIPNPSGFTVNGNNTDTNASGSTYIYIAIRRGPMAVPESATDVFDMSYATDANDASFPVDLMLSKIYGGGNTYARDRLRGGTKYLLTETTNADLTGSDIGFDDMTGTGLAGWGTSFIHYNLRRAPNFFDVVAYTGDGTTSRDIAHNLGVVPELQFIKRRTTSGEWWASATPAGAGKVLYLNRTNAAFSYTAFGTATATTFQTETVANNDTNFSGAGYSWFGFASLDGVSKVGSYTGNGSTQTIDCGFSSGARFVLIKRTDSTGDWYVWDTERGIVAGNDPHFSLNSTAAQVTTDDSIDPVSSGFAVNQVSATNINVSSATYIFYAIA